MKNVSLIKDLETSWEGERTSEDFGRIHYHLTLLLGKPNEKAQVVGVGKFDTSNVYVEGKVVQGDVLALKVLSVPFSYPKIDLHLKLKWQISHTKDNSTELVLSGTSKESTNLVANFIEDEFVLVNRPKPSPGFPLIYELKNFPPESVPKWLIIDRNKLVLPHKYWNTIL